MRRIGPKVAVAVVLVVAAWGYAALPLRAEPPHTKQRADVLMPQEGGIYDNRCMHYGACTNRSRNVSAPTLPESYPDGLRWSGERTSVKFSGNRLKLRVHF